MFGRGKSEPELNQRLISSMHARHREEELERDPSSIPGMTGSELADVINTGTIPTALLNSILDG